MLTDFHIYTPSSRSCPEAAGLGGELARCAGKVPTLFYKAEVFSIIKCKAASPLSTLTPVVPGPLIRCPGGRSGWEALTSPLLFCQTRRQLQFLLQPAGPSALGKLRADPQACAKPQLSRGIREAEGASLETPSVSGGEAGGQSSASEPSCLACGV